MVILVLFYMWCIYLKYYYCLNYTPTHDYYKLGIKFNAYQILQPSFSVFRMKVQCILVITDLSSGNEINMIRFTLPISNIVNKW